MAFGPSTGGAERPPVRQYMFRVAGRRYTTDMTYWNQDTTPTNQQHEWKLAKDIKAGDHFHTDRSSEGVVKALHDFDTEFTFMGQSEYRRDSVAVHCVRNHDRYTIGNRWWCAIYANDRVWLVS